MTEDHTACVYLHNFGILFFAYKMLFEFSIGRSII